MRLPHCGFTSLANAMDFAATSLAPLMIFSLILGLSAGGWTSLYSSIVRDAASASSPSSSPHPNFAPQKTTLNSSPLSSASSPSHEGSGPSSRRPSRRSSSRSRFPRLCRRRGLASREDSMDRWSCLLESRWRSRRGWRQWRPFDRRSEGARKSKCGGEIRAGEFRNALLAQDCSQE